MKHYKHLGPFSDILNVVRDTGSFLPWAKPGPRTRKLLFDALAFWPRSEKPRAVKVGRRWERDGVAGEAVSWSVGYGPRTQAWVLRPSGTHARLPGVVALHCHGAYKFYGKEKVADGPSGTPRELRTMRMKYYGNRAFANALAREGFVVLAHDTFSWGSRGMPVSALPRFDREAGKLVAEWMWGKDVPRRIAEYNTATHFNEATLAKYCLLLGTTLGGVVNYEDRVAVNYLLSRPDVKGPRVGCVGQSGGGLRAALLQATCDRIGASVSSGSMITFEAMLDQFVGPHNWMFYLPGWTRHGEWPDIAACRAPSPLMTISALGDELFSERGMRDAHARIAKAYRLVGKPSNYEGKFHPGYHRFDLAMQTEAFRFLSKHLK